MSEAKKVVLAYSGGLDTSVILRWLIEKHRCEVVAFCADIGQGEELIPVRVMAIRVHAPTRCGTSACWAIAASNPSEPRRFCSPPSTTTTSTFDIGRSKGWRISVPMR